MAVKQTEARVILEMREGTKCGSLPNPEGSKPSLRDDEQVWPPL